MCEKSRSQGMSKLAGGALLAASLVLLLSAPATASTASKSVGVSSKRPPNLFDFSPELDQGLLGQGRQAYRERADSERARDAYRFLKLNLEEHPTDTTAAWHFSLSCYFLIARVLEGSEERKAMSLEGLAAADNALEHHPDCGPCHLMSAIHHALYAKEVGIIRSLVGLPTVKRHLKLAIELDPEFGGGAPHRIQATILQKLPRILGGGRKSSREAIEKAIEIAPYEPLNWEFLSWLLLVDYDDLDGAVVVARQGLTVPRPGAEYLESLDALEWMQRVVDAYARQLVRGSGSGG
jgi:hypothetical protein